MTPSAITATFSNYSWSNDPSGRLRQITLSAPFTGSYSGTLYVVVEDPDGALVSGDVMIDGSTAILTLPLSGTLPVGSYTRPLVIHACRDAACTSEVRGSPQTVQKNLVIKGPTLNVSSLSYTSTGGVAPASQSVIVTTPDAGADFAYETFTYVGAVYPDHSTSMLRIDEVFTITKTSTGFNIQPKGVWPGRYTLPLRVTTPGYDFATLDINYEVGATTSQPFTLLTASAAVSGPRGASNEIPVYIDFGKNVQAYDSLRIALQTDDPDSLSRYTWLRFYDSSEITVGDSPAGNGIRLRLFANACFLGYWGSCAPVGTYSARVVVTASAYGQESTYTVPVTFTVTGP